MESAWLNALVGAGVGFLGAIPPGPLNVTVIRKATAGQRREAFRVALGGALIDTVICGGIGLGFGWALEKLNTLPGVKLGLAVFLVFYGIRILVKDRERSEHMADPEEEPGSPSPPPPPPPKTRLPVLVGLLHGAANPALIVNWTFLISFLVSNRVVSPRPLASAVFAVGIGVGVFGWFTLVIEILDHFRDKPIGILLRKSTTYAGVLLILFGLYFGFRAVMVEIAQ